MDPIPADNVARSPRRQTRYEGTEVRIVLYFAERYTEPHDALCAVRSGIIAYKNDCKGELS